MLTAVLFLGSAAAIYFACEFFVNGVEWLGRRLGVGETATGTILAAFGTALPESAVTFVAVVFGRDPAQKDIGVGAALGGPLVLATLSYAVVGVALMWNRRRLGRATRHIECESPKLRRDQAWFLGIFTVKVALGLLVFKYKPLLGILFLLEEHAAKHLGTFSRLGRAPPQGCPESQYWGCRCRARWRRRRR